MAWTKYTFCRVAKNGAEILRRLVPAAMVPKCEQLEAALTHVVTLSDPREFLTYFSAEIVSIVHELPDSRDVHNAVGGYLGGCLELAIADCAAAGISVTISEGKIHIEEAKPPA